MRSRLLLSIVFAMATVAPVMSAPTPAQVPRDVQHDSHPYDGSDTIVEPQHVPSAFTFTGSGESFIPVSGSTRQPLPGLKRSISFDEFGGPMEATTLPHGVDVDGLGVYHIEPETTIRKRHWWNKLFNDISDALNIGSSVAKMAPKR